MVVVSDTRGATGSGLIKLAGFDFAIRIARIESLGQAVHNRSDPGGLRFFTTGGSIRSELL
jgi:hypothetical protein